MKGGIINMENKMNQEEPKRDCHYYNFGDNSNFKYKCPSAYGARCELHDEFFSALTMDPKTGKYIGLSPSCKDCDKNNLEGKVE